MIWLWVVVLALIGWVAWKVLACAWKIASGDWGEW